jgi:hypothetical protein
MTSRLLSLLVLLLVALPATAQTDDKKETPPDPLAMPLPEGILTAVRFTVGGDINSKDDQATAFGQPVLLQLSGDRYLQRFDMIVVDRKGVNFQSIWQFRVIFLFPDMGSFVQWYSKAETKSMLGQFAALGARNLGMKLENIRNPQTVIQK